jgi:hypothetical protein
MEQLETQFGIWLAAKYGSLEKALANWSGYTLNPDRGDRPQVGRLGLPSAGDLVVQKDSRRAQDAAAFLTESQTQFFRGATNTLKQKLGYRGLVYASNWITADARTLGPLDKYSNTVADFMDRHGYFGGVHEGPAAGYALNAGDTYRDRSALLFTDADQKPDFNLPQMDIRYNGLPSTMTEINWTCPIASVQTSTSDGSLWLFARLRWVFLFQFRQSLGTIVRQVFGGITSNVGAISGNGTHLSARADSRGRNCSGCTFETNGFAVVKRCSSDCAQNLDAFRAQNVPPGNVLQRDRADSLDPLAPLVGKVNLSFVTEDRPARLTDLSLYIDRDRKTIRSSTRQLLWGLQQRASHSERSQRTRDGWLPPVCWTGCSYRCHIPCRDALRCDAASLLGSTADRSVQPNAASGQLRRAKLWLANFWLS